MLQEYVCVYVVCSGLTSLSTVFQSYHDGDWLRHGRPQCSLYSAALLKYLAPDTCIGAPHSGGVLELWAYNVTDTLCLVSMFLLIKPSDLLALELILFICVLKFNNNNSDNNNNNSISRG